MNDIHSDILPLIFGYLPIGQVVQAREVCRRWRNIIDILLPPPALIDNVQLQQERMVMQRQDIALPPYLIRRLPPTVCRLYIPNWMGGYNNLTIPAFIRGFPADSPWRTSELVVATYCRFYDQLPEALDPTLRVASVCFTRPPAITDRSAQRYILSSGLPIICLNKKLDHNAEEAVEAASFPAEELPPTLPLPDSLEEAPAHDG